MTLNDCVRTVATAVQPHLDKDVPNPMLVEDVVGVIYKLFAEQPNVEAAFVASIQAIVQAAREGWTPNA